MGYTKGTGIGDGTRQVAGALPPRQAGELDCARSIVGRARARTCLPTAWGGWPGAPRVRSIPEPALRDWMDRRILRNRR